MGPLVWKDLPEEKAMEYSHTLIDQFVSAGFTKIHLDTSMRLKDDDPNAPLETSVIAKRGALLCKTAEEAAKRAGTKPVYVIGSEVPIPEEAKRRKIRFRLLPWKACQYGGNV